MDNTKSATGIQEISPEVSKNISEKPTVSTNDISPEITPELLNTYSESLNELVIKYSKQLK